MVVDYRLLNRRRHQWINLLTIGNHLSDDRRRTRTLRSVKRYEVPIRFDELVIGFPLVNGVLYVLTTDDEELIVAMV